MIKCLLSHLEARCRERGYALEEVMSCVISQNNDIIWVDENHPSYPKKPKQKLDIKISSGPGTELKKLLGKIGIKASANCSCNQRAALMDTNGIEWCENNIDTIVGWLKEEATKRKLPFVEYAAKLLINRAISNAKKTLQNN
jgi:predicted Zn-dependent protease